MTEIIELERNALLQSVIQIVAKIMDREPAELRPEMSLAYLGCDSLEKVEIAMALEEEFDIAVPDEFGEDEATLNQLADKLVLLLKNPGG